MDERGFNFSMQTIFPQMKIFKDDNSLKNEGRENIILTLDKENIVNTKIAL